jgi:pyrimidine-nucleoside phosphorylase
MFNPISVIERKRDGQTLSKDEIDAIVDGFTRGTVKDYQMSAFTMAVCCRGMTSDEISNLTRAMLDSGRRLAPATDKPRVDKHSTGGLGDKISLILAPLLACCGLDVPMLSGRGLGITGGTLDKLEAIPGYRTNLSEAEIESQLRSIGCVITGTTQDVVPADRKLYALRDVTGTVPSIALITSSIMSKKMAESLTALSLDVKYGTGAFMRTKDLAEQLSQSLCRVGESFGVKTTARIHDMNYPTGLMVGNLNEVLEAIDVLKNQGPQDVVDLTIALCSDLLVSCNVTKTHDEAAHKLQQLLSSGAAYERFEQMVIAQQGSIAQLPKLSQSYSFTAPNSGKLISVDCYALGMAVIALGGGRSEVGQDLDHRVGLRMIAKPGETVQVGDELCIIYSDSNTKRETAHGWLSAAYHIQ